MRACMLGRGCLSSCTPGMFSVGREDTYVMSARINLSDCTRETNRDTCAPIPPALSNKPLEGNGRAGQHRAHPKIEDAR